MPTFKPEYLQELTVKIFVCSGAPESEARIVAEALVRADSMGMSSHGVLRVIQYIKDAQKRAIVPGAELLVESLSPTVSHRRAMEFWSGRGDAGGRVGFGNS